MDNRDIGLYLSRIISGQYIFTYNSTIYRLIYPDISIKYNAELYAQQEYENNKYNEWLTDDDVLYFLIDIGLWTIHADNQLKNIEKQIEDTKIELYNNFLNPKKIKSLRNSLNGLKKTIAKNTQTRHLFDNITIDGYCATLKNQYILLYSLYDYDHNLVFPNHNDINYNLLNSLSVIINDSTIDMTTFRTIARSEQWRNYWSANKDHIFDKSTIHWTDEQRMLVVLSKMYDSAYDHPECPTDEVIADDDIFDGWLLLQKRKADKEKSKHRTEELLKGKNLDKAKEVFLVANSKEEADNIYGLNDSQSRNLIKERSQFIAKTNSSIPESKLPDVQRDLVAQNNQQFINSQRKK